MEKQSRWRKSLGLLLIGAGLPFVSGCGGRDDTGPAYEANQGPGGPPGGKAEGDGDPKSPFAGGGKVEASSHAKGK